MKKILCDIKNKMRDCDATEAKLNDLLREYKETVLPEVVRHFNNMNRKVHQELAK